MVLALEASRLARSSADWHRLVEICVVTRTLLADEAAVYDPRDPNDRLLLGVKGTISEAETFTLRTRLHEGRWNKARRGELSRSLPVGYVRSESGSVIKDPDRQVQSRLAYIFRLFGRHKVAHQVLLQLVRERLQVPAQIWGGPRHGQVTWKEPDLSDVIRLLHNPTYAGAYVYGQKEYDSFDRSPTNGKARVHPRPLEDWPVCLRDVYPAYITWEQFVQNQEILRSNGYGFGKRGAARRGKALLQGIVYCGRCGARMSVLYYSTKEKRTPGYGCFYEYNRHGGKTCQCFSSAGVDAAVAGLFLERRVSGEDRDRPARPGGTGVRPPGGASGSGTSNSSGRIMRSSWPAVATRPRTRRIAWSRRSSRLPGRAALDRRERLQRERDGVRAPARSTRSARRTGSRSATSPPTWAGSGRRRRRRWRTARR